MDKIKHIWYYYKLPICGGIILISILFSIISDFLGIGRIYPDYQIAYVGKNVLPEDTINSLCEALENLGEDLNDDGKVIVQINQYTSSTAEIKYSSNIKLLADITECESYFFLLENPDKFQQEYEILDYNTGLYAWKSCPVLTGLELGEYSTQLLNETITGDNQNILNNLYFARRCFSPDNLNTVDNIDGCEKLWELLTKDASK